MNTHENVKTTSSLAQARALTLPPREAILQRAPSVKQFWHSNAKLLESAWQEWQKEESDSVFEPSIQLLDEKLSKAVEQAWQNPDQEVAVKNLWHEVAPGVFKAQFFNPARLEELRYYLDALAKTGIATRAPFGIVYNRRGAMLDPRSEGYLAAPGFQAFYNQLLDDYMRPIARLLMPEIHGFDSQTFGFSIEYQAGMDTSLQPHTDASAATLNININLPEEQYKGFEVDFYDPITKHVKRLRFEPGEAMLHRGSVPHAAQPITKGTRNNMVLWLYGEKMQIPVFNNVIEPKTAVERWTKPNSKKDKFAPF